MTEPAERGARVVWRAHGVTTAPAVPTGRRSSPARRGRGAVRQVGDIIWREENVPSIFVRTRSTAPEHPAHIIATFKTIGSLMAASVRSRTTGRKCPCGSSCAAEPRAGL